MADGWISPLLEVISATQTDNTDEEYVHQTLPVFALFYKRKNNFDIYFRDPLPRTMGPERTRIAQNVYETCIIKRKTS